MSKFEFNLNNINEVFNTIKERKSKWLNQPAPNDVEYVFTIDISSNDLNYTSVSFGNLKSSMNNMGTGYVIISENKAPKGPSLTPTF